MNSYNNYNAYSTQSSTSNAGTSSAIDAAMTGAWGIVVFGLLLAITLFVIQVWAMISMINLNTRFKNFLEDYWRHEDEKDLRNGGYRQQGSIASSGTSEDYSKKEALENYKTEEQKVAEKKEMIASMKPRRLYIWIAISIPILLIILGLVGKLYS